MSSYWKVDDVVQIGETKVEIPSENGLSYSGGQKISLFVPPTTKFMSGKDSYLQFDVKISLPSGLSEGERTLLQLDEAGAGILFKNLRIYDGSRGVLLEELTEYSSLVALKYDYDADDSLRRLRAMTEGGTTYTENNRGSLGTSKSAMADVTTNPYFQANAGKNASLTNSDFTTAKCCVPIHSGIFSGSIFPVMMTNGLYLEFDLQPASRVIKQLDNAIKDRRQLLNPVYASVFETSGGAVISDWTNGSSIDSLYFAEENSISGDADGVARFPFVVGERINFAYKTDNSSTATFSGDLIISEINACVDLSAVEVIFTDTSITNDTGTDIVSGEWIAYSTAVCDRTSYDATYEVSNFNLVVHQIEMDASYEKGMIAKAREGKAIEFDIHSVTTYKNSLLASDRQTSFLVHANNSRAKSLVVVPTDSSIYTSAQLISSSETYEVTADSMDIRLNSNRSGYVGVCDQLSSVQYMIDGKLVPSRPISTKKCATRESIDAFHLFELEKGLDNAGVTPRSFVKYLENWVLSRGFAVGQGAMDLRSKDLTVQLKFEETTAPSVPKMILSHVFHVRRLIMRSTGIEVQV